jgi:TrmH family RNA methyltransferase
MNRISLEDIQIVLVEPLYGGNVGSVARAMANFGLQKLTLVRPAEGLFEDPLLEPMARSNAMHILKNAVVTDDLAKALADTELSMGFTARTGKKRNDGIELRPAVRAIAEEFSGARIAAVFGCEDNGLSNEDLEKCHWMVNIPTHPTLTSLNLSQAVLLFAYEIFSVAEELEGALKPERRLATVEELEGFYGHLGEVLDTIGFIKEEDPARIMNAMRRIFSRRLPDPRDVHILRGMLSKVVVAIELAKKQKS